MSVPTLFDPDKLEQFCKNIFCRAGVPDENASIVAESLVQANLRGVDSHGVVRTKIYVERMQRGMVDAHAEVEVVSRSRSVAIVDGHNNYGPVVGSKAVSVALDIAREHGVSLVGARNSNHFGTCAYYALKAVEQNFIFLVMSNASQTMPPTGGIRPFLGTNPLAVGIPTGGIPFMLDMASSVVARGKIIVAAQKGQAIPEGWAVDKYGNPTTDANAALEGAVLPVGGPKGYGISMFVDILSGVLTGAGFGKYVNNMYENWKEPQNVGHLFIAVDIERFMPIERFKRRVDQYIAEIKAEPKAPGVDEILIPGELEHRLTEERRRNGIEIPLNLAKELKELGDRFGLDVMEAAKDTSDCR